jgi:hypothetical protein
MKKLAEVDSETQTDFFAKAGMLWNGISITWYCQVDKVMKGYCVNQADLEGHEDAIENISLLEMALRDHKIVHPYHNTMSICTDGAGAYTGAGFLLRLPYLYPLLGIRVEQFTTGRQSEKYSSISTCNHVVTHIYIYLQIIDLICIII